MNGFLRIAVAAALVAWWTPASSSAQRAAPAPGDTLAIDVAGAVKMALSQGVEADMARASVAAAEAQVGIARAAALPHIDLSAGYQRNVKKPVIFFKNDQGETMPIQLGEDNAYSATISLQQPVWTFGRVTGAYHAFQERAEAARLAGDAQAADITRSVKSAYYSALLAHEAARIAKAARDQAQRNVSELEARVGRGVSPEFELLRARVTLANRRASLTRSRNDARAGLDALKRLLAIRLDRAVVLTDSLSYEPVSDNEDEAVQRALASRRDLASARKDVEATRAELDARSANGMPMLYFDAAYSWQGQTSSGLWPGERETASSAYVGLSLSWPLWDGFETRYQTRQVQAQLRGAELRVRQIEDTVTLEVRNKYADVASVAQEIDAANEAVDVARKAYDIATVRYRRGLSTQVEFLDSELAMFQAMLQRSQTLFRYDVAVAELEYSTGSGPALIEE